MGAVKHKKTIYSEPTLRGYLTSKTPDYLNIFCPALTKLYCAGTRTYSPEQHGSCDRIVNYCWHPDFYYYPFLAIKPQLSSRNPQPLKVCIRCHRNASDAWQQPKTNPYLTGGDVYNLA